MATQLGERFKDNDEETVKAYASKWLQECSIPGSIDYLGKCRELPGKEPYRFMFMVERSKG